MFPSVLKQMMPLGENDYPTKNKALRSDTPLGSMRLSRLPALRFLQLSLYVFSAWRNRILRIP